MLGLKHHHCRYQVLHLLLADEEDHHGEWNAQDMDAIDDSSPSGGTLAAPQLLPCEGGGFIVDTSTVSSSPIRAFTKIADLAPHERDSYRNQFSYSKSGRGRGRPRKSGVSGAGMRGRPPQTNTWGRDDFDELVAGGYVFFIYTMLLWKWQVDIHLIKIQHDI